MQFTSGSVEIKHIDLNDFTYKISTHVSLDSLKASIEIIGLLTPPILQRTADDKYIVVSGFQRIIACSSLGWHQIEARIIAETEKNLSALKLAIADNAINRELNVIEQAVSISKLSSFYPDPVELTRESQKIGLNVNPGLIKKLKIINSTHNLLKKKVSEGAISIAIALELSNMEENAVIAFTQIFESLHPTLNHQKEMIRLTREISRLKNIPIFNVINDDAFIDQFSDPEMERNQKIKNIRRHLKQIRYPEIVRFESNYQARLKRIKLPESIQLNPPPDFEGNRFSILLSFQDLSQFKSVNEELSKLQNHPDFAKILEKEFENN